MAVSSPSYRQMVRRPGSRRPIPSGPVAERDRELEFVRAMPESDFGRSTPVLAGRLV
jgi:hypothetical protein